MIVETFTNLKSTVGIEVGMDEVGIKVGLHVGRAEGATDGKDG